MRHPDSGVFPRSGLFSRVTLNTDCELQVYLICSSFSWCWNHILLSIEIGDSSESNFEETVDDICTSSPQVVHTNMYLCHYQINHWN